MSPHKSKTVATWLALLGGGLGLHRFYLYGLKDVIGWLFPLPTLLGWIGIQRVQSLGLDDSAAWLLIPLGGLALSITMFTAIYYGLTSDERWDAKHNPGTAVPSQSGWPVVIGVIVSLLVGATVLTSTITISLQRLFEASAAAEPQPTR